MKRKNERHLKNNKTRRCGINKKKEKGKKCKRQIHIKIVLKNNIKNKIKKCFKNRKYDSKRKGKK